MKLIQGKGKPSQDTQRRERNGLLAKIHVAKKQLGLTDDQYEAVLRGFGFHTGPVAGVSAEALLTAMRADKKRRGGRLRLVLQRGIGDTVLQEVETQAILRVLRALGAETGDSG